MTKPVPANRGPHDLPDAITLPALQALALKKLYELADQGQLSPGELIKLVVLDSGEIVKARDFVIRLKEE